MQMANKYMQNIHYHQGNPNHNEVPPYPNQNDYNQKDKNNAGEDFEKE